LRVGIAWLYLFRKVVKEFEAALQSRFGLETVYLPLGRITPPELSLCSTEKLMPLHDAVAGIAAEAGAASGRERGRRNAADGERPQASVRRTIGHRGDRGVTVGRGA